MQLIKNHKLTVFFLLLYYAWWTYIVYYAMQNGVDSLRKPAGSNLPLISMSIIAVYFFTMLYKVFTSKGNANSENIIFLWIVSLPVLAGVMYVAWQF